MRNAMTITKMEDVQGLLQFATILLAIPSGGEVGQMPQEIVHLHVREQ